MKRIGILTFWGVPNYGAFAQAYALNKLLKKNYKDCEVKHMAYLHQKHHDLYYKKRKPTLSSVNCLLSPSFFKKCLQYYINPYKTYPEFEQDWNSIDHISLSNNKSLEDCYQDVIVTGSDAIWEFSIPEFGNDIHLIGNNLNCNKLVSYAASFGDMKPNDNFDSFIKIGLGHYDDISVRDENSRVIVNSILGKECAKLVLDPTLVYDFKEDTDIPKSKYDNYVLVYGNDFPQELINKVVRYARENKLSIIGAGIAPNWCDHRFTDIGPKAWIGLFRNAEFVVTCTFHGLMFGINYEKKIVFNQVEYVKNRSTTLLQKLGLYDLYKNGVDLVSSLNYSWDYVEIKKKLNEMRKESLCFLRGIGGNE